MSLRDPFEKNLYSVVEQMKTQSNDMMLLERWAHRAQFLYHGKVYLLDFPESEPESLLFPQVYEYESNCRRVVFDRVNSSH